MVMIIIRAYNAENTQVKLYNMYLENLNALKGTKLSIGM